MKETKADRTKAFILEKVSPIFNAQGFAGTSLTDVLNATELTKGSVYGNFENKEDLAQKAFSYNLMQVLKPLQEKIAEHSSSIKKLKAITDFYRTYYGVMMELGGCPILNVVTDAKKINEPLYNEAVGAAQIMISNLEEIIELGISQKKFKKKINSRELALVIYGMIQGAVFLSSVEQTTRPLQLMADQVDEVIKSNRK
ncbi:MAG: TetR/AcrR family transcriptional regulator [Flavobacteriales bacterium]|nr:TetR/AcrR family transcriptional regulator [Flavobacteriales bacterium]MCB9195732.1 TetR/AcrR family transcriptional regulator [Flavobacteriales bacterium]